MGSGTTIPYQLRQNKVIERNLFVDLLSRINRTINISDYTYIGFGGPFMEDFKILHGALRISSMISIESNKNVHKRQEYNKPASCIELKNLTSGDFITEHDFSTPTIAWLDFTDPSNIPEQLSELTRLTAKLCVNDIFKITLNANPDTLGRPEGALQKQILEYRVDEATKRLGEYVVDPISESDVSQAGYPKLLLKAIKNAAGRQLNLRNIILPLTSFKYKDGQQMLTATGLITQSNLTEKFLIETRLKYWSFFDSSWYEPKSIGVPDFSPKERLAIEGLLPTSDSESISTELGFYFGENTKHSTELLDSFIEYYRVAPWFSKVVF